MPLPMLLAVIFSVLGSSHADVKGGSILQDGARVKGGSILQDGARAASVAGTSVLHETSGNTSMEMTSAPARMLSGQASPGCHKCCSEQDCTEAFRGSPGMCCRATPATCCPNGYTCAAPAGCRRNHGFGGGNRFNPGMSHHGQASRGCQKCCSEQDCTGAFNGSPGLCCKATPATCCPNGYTCAGSLGCKPNHGFGGGSRFNPGMSHHGQASRGCQKCCSEQECNGVFKGSPGMCCRATPATCCPDGYTCAAPAGCRRNHTFGGGNRFNPGMSQHSLGGGNMSLLRRSTLPCPLWVGTNTTPICLTGDPLLQIGACYNVSNGMAQVTCIQALKENGERRNLTNYVNFQCSPGSEDKCLFQKSYGTLLNSSVTVQEKFEAAPIVFKGVNSKLVGLGIMAGLASLTGGAAVLVLRRVKVYFANSGRTESLIEEPDESLEE